MLRIPREASLVIQYVLDELLPPRLRDSWLLMKLPIWLMFRREHLELKDFKDRAFGMTDQEFANAYKGAGTVNFQGDTDLNKKCTNEILKSIRGKSVLDAGCGRGYLAGRLASIAKTTGVDLGITDEVRHKYPNVDFQEGRLEALPFEDAEFDTVVCTHTLEHVQDLPLALQELRRVTRHRLIVVVPRQRPYKYTFSLHIHFFPYKWSLESQFGSKPNTRICQLGDWYYQEDLTPVEP